MTVNRLIRLLCAGLLGVCVALLVACGSSGKGLIPAANAGPLQSDFEAVAREAQSGEGSCTATEAAIAKTESDFAALPASVDEGLRKTLSKGIANLRREALKLCKQPLPQATTSTSTPTKTTTTSTQTTSTTTTPTPTTSTQTTPTTTTPTATTPGGGTPAPGNESSPGASNGPGGGTGIGIGGESGSGAGGAGGSGGADTPGAGASQESGK
jgi:cytoskeletal protein RodZ